MRRRDPGRPRALLDSSRTPAIGPLTFVGTLLAAPSDETFRRSMSTVSGSGRVARYGTGSVASMTSDAPFALTRDVIDFTRTPVFPPAADPDAPVSAAATAIVTDKRKALVAVTTWR